MSTLEAKTRYDAAEVEPRIVRRWLDSGLFHAEPEGGPEENYSIAVPPPNVTGALHMGHALNGAIQDVLIRYHRARGKRTKWIAGTDHAGIATQKQVEKRLAEEGTSREELGREAFEQRVWEWREQYGGTIIEQFQRLGASLDYEDERFTLDAGYHDAVLRVFVDLYEKGYIYRDNYLVNWDPGSGSAISDLEVENRTVVDSLTYVAYPIKDSRETITVATVRPETMLADTAVAVNPHDERYRHLVGRTAILPLVGRELPIIADDYVKPEFGTGALKITPGHDPNDFELGRRHGLPEITVIGEDGRMTAQAGERFAGLTVVQAQHAVLAALQAEGRLVRSEPYEHEVPFSHRSGERVEPLISLQWFMRMDELAQPAIDAVKDGRVQIHPQRWTKVYLDWMENIRPWCVSRQLWWGHRLPVWYRTDPAPETYVGATPPEGEGWEQDPDVLDTWFSSALWPFATLGWPEQTPELTAFYPTDVLSTARDILFLWVARMIMMGLEFAGDVPFEHVYIHSVIQAPDGRRMSKSLGTGIDPLDEIEKHGADGVRFGLLAMSSSQDVRYSAEKVQQGEQLTNKLWNASRLILTRVDADARAAARPRTIEDRWILSRLAAARETVEQHIVAFRFSHAALALYDFVYGELCDWYLELIKPRLYEAEGKERADLEATLLHVLTETLQFAHPVIPFVTEEIWSFVPGAEGLLVARQVGTRDASARDSEAERALADAIAAVTALRGWRDGVGAAAGARIPGRLEAQGYDETVAHVARLARFELVNAQNGATDAATIAIPGGAVVVHTSDAVDLGAAERKLAERRTKLEAEIGRCESKLANDGFVAKAPAAVVEAERAKLAELRAELQGLGG